MNSRLLLALLFVSLAAFGQTSPPPASNAPDAPELTRMLNDFLAGASRNDPAAHGRFWADDLIYTGSSGRRVSKADIMRDLKNDAASHNPEEAAYHAEDIRIQQYGTTAIVAFRLVGVTKKGEATETQNYLNSGTFLKRDGKWQVVNWQATKIPPAEQQKK